MLAWLGRFNRGSGKPEGCTRLRSDLAVFLQLDALPNANHSVTVVGAFYVPPAQVPGEAGNGHGRIGAFYVPPARKPVEAALASATIRIVLFTYYQSRGPGICRVPVIGLVQFRFRFRFRN
ncbi:Hypothetical predicted protein [Octopus vulgaris]|uniref:Uncharacterized protein n=1 Tax=Octopus vulgaris TaxID=6645 RepID=A0AA36BWA0_OCTVU|nr:Hypothetical predicted protein [Octopus vulgaris]